MDCWRGGLREIVNSETKNILLNREDFVATRTGRYCHKDAEGHVAVLARVGATKKPFPSCSLWISVVFPLGHHARSMGGRPTHWLAMGSTRFEVPQISTLLGERHQSMQSKSKTTT